MRSVDRQFEYDKAYMKMALAIASLSYAERKKVGCIIVSKDDQVISQGYNGTPTGWDNCCEKMDPIAKRLITVPECLHAETNAITKCAKFLTSTQDSTVYVTLSPCFECAKILVQSGIKRVVFYEGYRNLDGVYFLNKCGIEVEQINMNDEDPSWKFITDVKLMKEGNY